MKKYSGVIVKCGNEVLLCRRNHNNGNGEWSIPSGKLDKKVSEDASVQYTQNRNAYMSLDTAKSLFGTTLVTNVPNQNYSDLQKYPPRM